MATDQKSYHFEHDIRQWTEFPFDMICVEIMNSACILFMVSGTRNERRRKIDCASAKWNRLVVLCFFFDFACSALAWRIGERIAFRPFSAKSRFKLIPTIIFRPCLATFLLLTWRGWRRLKASQGWVRHKSCNFAENLARFPRRYSWTIRAVNKFAVLVTSQLTSSVAFATINNC